MLTDLFCALLLLAISLFATFRVAEMNWRKTYWADISAFVYVSIGAFAKGFILLKSALYPGYISPFEYEASALFYVGVAMALWSVTCGRARRATDRRDSAKDRTPPSGIIGDD